MASVLSLPQTLYYAFVFVFVVDLNVERAEPSCEHYGIPATARQADIDDRIEMEIDAIHPANHCSVNMAKMFVSQIGKWNLHGLPVRKGDPAEFNV